MKKVGIIGGGINGIFISWRLASLGYKVDLYEKEKILQQTSASSSKLLHGGIRYLEQGHIGLVRESLLNRSWWLKNAPDLCRPIEICMPIYQNSPRSALKLYAGALLYKILSGKHSLGPTSWRGKHKTKELFPEINNIGLNSSVSFYDAQMNESKLGSWVADNAKRSGCKIYEDTKVDKFDIEGNIYSDKLGHIEYDFVINAAGPWASEINLKNNIDSKFYLRLIRGSHIILNKKISRSYLFQEPTGTRVVFVLPYLEKTLIGTTEVPQDIDSDIKCSSDERDYLLKIFNDNFYDNVRIHDIHREFSGLRPIVSSHLENKESYFSFASRESKIELLGKLLTVYGGKWTTAPSLSERVVKKAVKFFKEGR